VSTPPKLLGAALLTLSCALLCAVPVTALGSSPQGAPHVSSNVRGHGKRRLHRSKRSAAARCRAARHHRECGARAGGTRAKGKVRAKHTSTPTGVAPVSEATLKSSTPSVHESVAATIAAVLATPCQNTEVLPSTDDLAVVRGAVLCLINRVRAEHSESPLKTNAQLEAAAEGHCQELIADDYFAHVSPSGETPVDRIQKTGYVPSPSDGYVIGENLAWGTYVLATPQSIVSAWIASPGHLANILESQYRETGIAITPAVPASLGEGNPGATYAQEFGVIIH